MNFMKRFIYLVMTIFYLTGCGGSSVDKPKNCSIKEQNRYVYEYMQKNYLWYKDLPEVDYENYSSPESLLRALRYYLDKWSFIIDKETLDSYYSGEGYIGYGFKMQFIDEKLYIMLVYPNSPADNANLARGVQILKINGKDVDDVDDIHDINTAFGEDKVGVETTLEVKINEQIKNVTMQKAKVTAPSVLKKVVLDVDNKKIGYLLFDKFIEPSTNELKEAFGYFKAQNIDDLIVDLRYNGGGLVSVANDLVSLIIGQGSADEISFGLHFNDKKSSYNRYYYINSFNNSFDLQNVYFITTKNSCSASEAVINALSPYGVNVAIIGNKTCGKPVGMVGDDFCGKYIIPIEFSIANSNNKADYFGGMNVDCSVNDDIYHDFGNTNEAMLKEVIYYIQNGSCSSSANLRLSIKSNKKRVKLTGFKAITNAF